MDRRKNDLLDRTVSPVGCALRIPQSDLSSFYTPSLRIYLFKTVLKQALVINSKATGEASRFQIDTTISGLNFSETSQAQDALIAIGATATSGGILVNSSSNRFSDTIQGIELNIKETSETPIEIDVNNDDSGIEKSLDLLVTQYNKVVDRLKSVASYDTTTNVAGLLYGSTEVLRIQQTFGTIFTGRVVTGSKFRSVAELGIGFDDQGKMSLDKTRFRARLASDPEAVRDFLSKPKTGFSARAKQLIDNLSGERNSVLITRSMTLQSQVETNNTRITFLTSRLDKQRERLLNQFYKTEEAIQKIQSNQGSVSSLANLLNSSKS